MIELFTPKRISPDCPFKSTPRLLKILILTLRCAFWHCGVMHTAELDSAFGSTPQSFLRNLVTLTPRCDAHCGVWLRGWKHTTESDSAVGCTPQSFLRNLVALTLRWCTSRSLTPQRDAHHRAQLRGGMQTTESDWFENARFCVFLLAKSSDLLFSKNFEVKKIHWTICDL